ncbi:MAG: Lrp/AsnC family transcriptional regulator [Clostridia bacterium]|nr:Lrp/AsnC family transcriptional regulator [Clostridia bacterium]
METILKLLENDSRLTAAELASMLNLDEDSVRAAIAEYEKNGTIVAYKALIDWDKTDREIVSAVIELKVTPQRDRGFDKIAEKLLNYPEITSICLMSGSYDIQLIIEGKTLREVAQFVAMKLAPMECITATSTSFVLKKYKDKGVIYQTPEEDERGSCPV